MNNTNDQVTPAETAELLRLAEQQLAVPGDFVELGCYRGDTSVLLGKLLQKHTNCGKPVQNSVQTVDNQCKTSPKQCKTGAKRLWIYDSFAGLPEKSAEDQSGAGANFQKGELLVTKREVIAKLRKHGLKTSSHPSYTNQPHHLGSTSSTDNANTFSVIVKKAWFDELADHDLPELISYAFCDGDLYDSIKTSLSLVAPRLSDQGIIIVHDYNNPELPGSARAVDEFLRAHPTFRLQVYRSLAILSKEC